MMNPVEAVRDFLSRRRNAYCKTFLTPYGDEVLVDLAKFCRAHQTTFHQDARAHAVAEGRREVWLRIQQHLQLSDKDIWAIYSRNQTTKE